MTDHAPTRLRTRIQTFETYDGPEFVNGQVHGSKWKKGWEVVVRFETEAEAKDFMVGLDIAREALKKLEATR